MIRKSGRKCFGIIGGLGAIAGADIFFKLVKSTHAYSQEAPPSFCAPSRPVPKGYNRRHNDSSCYDGSTI